MSSLTLVVGEIEEAVAALGRQGSLAPQIDLRRSLWIGRSTICNLMVHDDSQVSRLHAVLDPDGDDFVLADMRSLNGTRVNGHRVSRCRLGEGDVIELGSSTRLVYSRSAPAGQVLGDGASIPMGTSMMVVKEFADAPTIGPGSVGDRSPGARLDEFLQKAIDRMMCESLARTGAALLLDGGTGKPVALGRIRDESVPGPHEIPADVRSRMSAFLKSPGRGPVMAGGEATGSARRPTITLQPGGAGRGPGGIIEVRRSAAPARSFFMGLIRDSKSGEPAGCLHLEGDTLDPARTLDLLDEVGLALHPAIGRFQQARSGRWPSDGD